MRRRRKAKHTYIKYVLNARIYTLRRTNDMCCDLSYDQRWSDENKRLATKRPPKGLRIQRVTRASSRSTEHVVEATERPAILAIELPNKRKKVAFAIPHVWSVVCWLQFVSTGSTFIQYVCAHHSIVGQNTCSSLLHCGS